MILLRGGRDTAAAAAAAGGHLIEPYAEVDADYRYMNEAPASPREHGAAPASALVKTRDVVPAAFACVVRVRAAASSS